MEWEKYFLLKESSSLQMTLKEFVEVYTNDMKPKLRRNTWIPKEYVINGKLLPQFRHKKMNGI